MHLHGWCLSLCLNYAERPQIHFPAGVHYIDEDQGHYSFDVLRAGDTSEVLSAQVVFNPWGVIEGGAAVGKFVYDSIHGMIAFYGALDPSDQNFL